MIFDGRKNGGRNVGILLVGGSIRMYRCILIFLRLSVDICDIFSKVAEHFDNAIDQGGTTQ